MSSPPVTLSNQIRFSRITQEWTTAVVGLVILYIPTFTDLFRTIWASDQQGHGPIVLGLTIWLFWRRKNEFRAPKTNHKLDQILGWPLLLIGTMAYSIGRSQDIKLIETASLIPTLTALILLIEGRQKLSRFWFPIFFMLFMLPLPGAFVDALTQPMKLAVSYATETLLYSLSYPVSRTGVILQVGSYQLLVADACAGLNTLFTLEAIGLLYLNVVQSASTFRNVALGLLIIPISFTANVIRVIVLCLITYHLGDEAGQGFLHAFAGMVLFLSALSIIIFMDAAVRFVSKKFSGA